MDEAELIGAARSGDRQAFDELVRRTFVDTFTLARRLTGNEEDARDVVQEAYLRAWKGIGKFRGDAAFSTWMYRITANTASTHVHAAPAPARRAVRRRLRARRHPRRGAGVAGRGVGRGARPHLGRARRAARRSCAVGRRPEGRVRAARTRRSPTSSASPSRPRRCACTGRAASCATCLYDEGAEAHAV